MLKITFNNLKPINTRLTENKTVNVKGSSCIFEKTKNANRKAKIV